MSAKAIVRSFEVTIKGFPGKLIVTRPTRGQAKSFVYRDAKEFLPYLRWVDLRARSLGQAVTGDDFLRTACNRDVPFARIGMRVRFGYGLRDGQGVIVGNTSGANFDVFFTSGPSKGRVGSVHPNCEIAYFDDAGQLIKHFTTRQETNAPLQDQ